MGWTRRRVTKSGAARYLACYRDLRGEDQCVGTFSTEREADRAWQRAEARVAEGRQADMSRGRQRFREYVEQTWLPHHLVELTTRQRYDSVLNCHIYPTFGSMRMVDVTPGAVREWVTALSKKKLAPATVKKCMATLSAVFTTALNDQIIYYHPCKGVKTPTTPKKSLRIVTPEEFDTLYVALPNSDAKLLVETDIETGLRWGELAELRVRDLNTKTRILTVSRTVVELSPKFHPEGQRFLVKPYPKDREHRRFKLTQQINEKLKAHISIKGLDPDDLIFSVNRTQVQPPTRTLPDPDTLGYTEPNEKGRRYRHGTTSAYGAGRCRCDHCRAACAAYRARRRAEGKDVAPGPRRTLNTDADGHIPRSHFRSQVWLKALKAADLEFHVRPHDLRHAHASWLLHGGADLQVVKERLGHASMATTEKYLHTLPDADETALDALTRIRSRSSG